MSDDPYSPDALAERRAMSAVDLVERALWLLSTTDLDDAQRDRGLADLTTALGKLRPNMPPDASSRTECPLCGRLGRRTPHGRMWPHKPPPKIRARLPVGLLGTRCPSEWDVVPPSVLAAYRAARAG